MGGWPWKCKVFKNCWAALILLQQSSIKGSWVSWFVEFSRTEKITRGTYTYSDNSTKRMIKNLQDAYPSISEKKVIAFDCDATELDKSKITKKPEICFIDAKHTNTAVFSDFKFCLEVCHPDAIIAFHDANLIFEGIENIRKFLLGKSIQFQGLLLGGCVYAILLNKAIVRFAVDLESFAQDETAYFNQAKKELRKIRLVKKYYVLKQYYKLCRSFKKRFLYLSAFFKSN